MGELDPQARELLEFLAQSGTAQVHQHTLEQTRAYFEMAPSLDVVEPIACVRDLTVESPAGSLRLRVYHPDPESRLPVTVFFHGGGWVIGSLDSHDPLCRSLANRVPCVVVAVDYRLAPEHPWPAAVEDADFAVRWVAEHGDELEADASLLAVAGDSAGGNLAAVTALKDRDSGRHQVAFQLLFYPATDYDWKSASMRENSDGYFLTRADMKWFENHYLQGQDPLHPYVAPMRARSLAGLPPAFIITAEFDPLRDQGNAYGRRLAAEGAAVTVRCYPGMIHGFVGMRALIKQGDVALDDAAAALRAGLHANVAGVKKRGMVGGDGIEPPTSSMSS